MGHQLGTPKKSLILVAITFLFAGPAPVAEAADICGAIRLLRFNHQDDYGKYRGSPRRSGEGKYAGKLKIDGTESCILTASKGSTGARYRCFSADMDKAAAVHEVQEVIADVDACLKSLRYKKEVARDTRSTASDTTWIGNGDFVNVSADLSGSTWSWSISVGIGEP